MIIEAAANADPQLGKLLKVAVERAGSSKMPPPTRAVPRTQPFPDAEVQRVAEVMFDALGRINAKSVAENREYYFTVFALGGELPPNVDPKAVVRTLRATAFIAGDLATVPPSQRRRIASLTKGEDVRAWAHTHGGPDPRFDNENFSPGDLAYSNANDFHAGLGTPAGRFLFFNVDDGVEYDLTPMFGSLPT